MPDRHHRFGMAIRLRAAPCHRELKNAGQAADRSLLGIARITARKQGWLSAALWVSSTETRSSRRWLEGGLAKWRRRSRRRTWCCAESEYPIHAFDS